MNTWVTDSLQGGMHVSHARKNFGLGRLFLGGRSSRTLIAAGLLFAGIAAAEDLTTTDGKLYKNVTVTKVEPDGLSVSHETGTAKLLFTKLPEDLQRKHNYDPAKAEAFVQERNRKRAELESILEAAKEKEAALKRERMMESFTVTPEAAQGIAVVVDSRDKIKEELAARWRMELYREDEIGNKLASVGVKARLRVTWRRQDYDAAATEHFKVILSDATGKVVSRIDPEYRAPKQIGDGVYLSGMTLNLERDPGEEFRVRVVDRNQGVFADFTVRGKEK